MSEITMCNHCALRAIREQAKQDGLKVSIRLDPRGREAGFWDRAVNCYVHPPEVEPDHDEHFVAKFAILTDHCVCSEHLDGQV